MSSMNLSRASSVSIFFHIRIAWLFIWISLGSRWPVNRLAYAGAILVPIAVPCNCR